MVQEKDKFGEWLRRWRNERGLTQEEAGRAVGVSKQHISNLERGQTHYQSGSQAKASIEVVDKLAKLLKRPVEEARDLAGYGLPKAPTSSTEPDSIEDALKNAMFFDGKGLSDEDLAKIRPLLEVVDREVDRLKKDDK